jgi:uncharacterized membrane protein YfcA
MNELSQLSPLAWHAALDAARHQRIEHVGGLIRCLRPRNFGGGVVLLVGLVLLCVALAGHHDPHLEIVMAAITLASVLSSIAGFAFSAISGAMLFHLGDNPVQVVQVMVICSIANQATMTWSVRHDINWSQLGVYLSGGVVGLLAGVWILLHTARTVYAPALGLFLLGYGAYMLFRKPLVIRKQHAGLDFVTGILGGITGGAAGFPGAFVSIWCGMKGWEKARQRAVVQPFILIMQILALLAISLVRRQAAGGFGFDLNDLLFIPASLLGTSVGLALYRRLSDGQFARAVNILLIISGFSYVM